MVIYFDLTSKKVAKIIAHYLISLRATVYAASRGVFSARAIFTHYNK
jgi:hypothetical protein